jgi:hypothetical protein
MPREVADIRVNNGTASLDRAEPCQSFHDAERRKLSESGVNAMVSLQAFVAAACNSGCCDDRLVRPNGTVVT